jgi:hypothetical protein
MSEPEYKTVHVSQIIPGYCFQCKYWERSIGWCNDISRKVNNGEWFCGDFVPKEKGESKP